MEVTQSLKATLKRLRLSGMVPTLLDRVAYAKNTQLSLLDFMELCLQDEIDRREQQNLSIRLKRASFSEEQTFESFDWNASVTFDRQRVKDLLSLGFLERKEDALFLGPVGVGKTFLASALGHSACRAGKHVLFTSARKMFKELFQARADLTFEKTLRRFLSPELLIIDDFGLSQLDASQSSDLYEIVVERHRRTSTIVTSNRSLDEWIPLFNDPLLAQSAIDRIAHNAHQIVIEGESYRKQKGTRVKSNQANLNGEKEQDKKN